jgi:hypothetical protein
MKRRVCFFMGVILLFFLLFLPKPNPAQASSSLSPGFYVGWVSYEARVDLNGKGDIQGTQYDNVTIEDYTGRGQLMVKINGAGAGGASIVLPTTISRIYYTSWVTPKGNCTMTDTTQGRSNYVHLRDAPTAMGDTFQAPFNPAALISFTSEKDIAFETGELGGCLQMSEAELTTNRVLIKGDLSLISAIQFQIKYQTDTEMGGACSFPGWNQKMVVPYEGTNIYSLPKCSWRVFKSDQTQPQTGWK